MTVIRRTECPRHGPKSIVGTRCHVQVTPYVLCDLELAEVEYVPAEHLRTAVEALREIAERTYVPADFPNAAVRLQWASSRAANAVASLASPSSQQPIPTEPNTESF